MQLAICHVNRQGHFAIGQAIPMHQASLVRHNVWEANTRKAFLFLRLLPDLEGDCSALQSLSIPSSVELQKFLVE